MLDTDFLDPCEAMALRALNMAIEIDREDWDSPEICETDTGSIARACTLSQNQLRSALFMMIDLGYVERRPTARADFWSLTVEGRAALTLAGVA
ncbi:hypothetical protein H2509_14020 [Stappia sp. F7233]|uniref:MarR family transcriptional regulator n=1 Tax=Stappia albiluteola TaxID=2758565 RepID=A0A839AF50_9HYPH|nr:hypothetical protein [Stappia albiluteola]MBA5778241.1 hypothetical protein [Stappia albiluteola]